MGKRHTTVRLDELTDRQIQELSEKFSMTATDVIARAVDRMYQQEVTMAQTKEWFIEQLAGIYASRVDAGLTPEQVEADLNEVNDGDGFTFDGPEGENRNWIRYRDMHMPDGWIDEAVKMGKEMLAQPEKFLV